MQRIAGLVDTASARAYGGAMPTIVARFGAPWVYVGVLVVGCTSGDDDGMGHSQGADESSTSMGVDGTAAATEGAEDTLDPGSTSGDADATSIDPTATGSATEDESTGDDDGSETGSEAEFDEEFMWVADFLRTNCVACHATNANGSLVLPNADISNDEVRLALDGVVANTQLLLVEPFDRQASQTYLQITNEFGAQFPVGDTDRFGAWIDAGAPYFAP